MITNEKVKIQDDTETSKPADLPVLCAYDIGWDTDGNADVLHDLPKEILIPNGMVDDEEISDYLSDQTGFCHSGFKLGIVFRGKSMPYYTNWLDDDTFQMWFGEDIFKDCEGDSYLLKFEKHLKDNEWVVEVIWDEDFSNIEKICCNADDYITANEIWKIERICEDMIQLDQNEDDQCSTVKVGETYKFAGYDWTVCEVDNKRHAAVIQSHGATHGAWPGYVMQKFGGKANAIYGSDIDGEDISAYDDKMQVLYDAIKEVEDMSATYGKGLYIISKEKAGFAKWGQSGSGNYWQALKKAAENASLFGSPNYNAWLGTVNGSYYTLYANRNGYVYNYNGQYGDFVVAPAFNLDLSKVEIVGDEIITKLKKSQKLEIDKMLTISSCHVSADTKDLLDQAANDNEEDPMPPVFEKQRCGWFVACNPDNEETWDNYPADLVQCMKLARDNGCFWLCLATDGPRLETLDFFDYKRNTVQEAEKTFDADKALIQLEILEEEEPLLASLGFGIIGTFFQRDAVLDIMRKCGAGNELMNQMKRLKSISVIRRDEAFEALRKDVVLDIVKGGGVYGN